MRLTATASPFGLIVFMISALVQVVRAEQPDATGLDLFEKKIRPALVKHCYECHSADAEKVQGGLLLDTREAMRAGGETGPAVVPKEPKKSLLLEAIRYEGLEMPPEGKLPSDVVADFERWIAMGAPDPRENTAKIAAEKPKWEISEKTWWSDPPRQPPLPTVKDMTWPQSDIDTFILARLEQKSLKPNGNAEPTALIRRLYFDLIGLPPSPEELDAFLRDPSPKAYAEVIDRLLASQHFGERWGRHWLDVARFAESNGRGRNVLYFHAWRYRDYVVAAMNADKPYDRFITEQIAGDLLPASSPAERDEHMIATGFLAIGPKTLTDFGEQLTMNIVDEQIDVVTRSILAFTVACARCHDHKFDPIPTTDYYALAGIFRSTNTWYGKGIEKSTNRYVSLAENRNLHVLGPEPDKQLDLLREEIERIKKYVAEAKPQSKEAKDELAKMQARLRDLQSDRASSIPVAMAVTDVDRPEDCHVLIRGEIKERGEQVPRRMLSAVRLASTISVNPAQSGRLELARWLTDPSNPLTARVAVNRIWLKLFGRGIVPSVDNFGAMGDEPSHPELLDHLAVTFVEDGWSVKRLIREIVLSRTYRLSSRFEESKHLVDPENALIWRMSPRRLDAEALRDAMLHASGKLNLTPPTAKPIHEMSNAGDISKLERPFPYRSVYLSILREQLPEMLELFDVADPSMVVGQRSMTNVPSQSLYLMNSPFVLDQADSLAERILEGTILDRHGRVTLAYKLCLSRQPTQQEMIAALNFIKRMDHHLPESITDSAKRTHAPWAAFCQALLGSAEFRFLD